MRLSSHAATAAIVLALSPFAGGTLHARQDRQMGGIGVTVFADSNFRGRNATFRDEVADLARYGLNDAIDSLQVGPGEVWEVCEHASFAGRCQVFSGAETNLRARGWGDSITSMRRIRGGGGGGRPPTYAPIPPQTYGLEVFSDRQFKGERRMLTGPVVDFRSINFNDRAESLRLPPSQSWEVCIDRDFNNCRVINSDWPDLGGLGIRERISSARPWSQGGSGGGTFPPRPAYAARIVLHSDRSYRGQAFALETAASSLPGFGDRAESLQVFGGRWRDLRPAQLRRPLRHRHRQRA